MLDSSRLRVEGLVQAWEFRPCVLQSLLGLAPENFNHTCKLEWQLPKVHEYFFGGWVGIQQSPKFKNTETKLWQEAEYESLEGVGRCESSRRDPPRIPELLIIVACFENPEPKPVFPYPVFRLPATKSLDTLTGTSNALLRRKYPPFNTQEVSEGVIRLL